MISISSLTKTFDGFTALDEVNLSAKRGSIYGLVGPNGSGKTTIIRHLSGTMRQDSGEILIDGQPVDENLSVKEKVFLIPDDPYFFPGANIQDMRKFYENIYPRFDNILFGKLQEIFPLDQKRSIRKFSRGMQKQAAFWLAVCCRPDVLLLDEPVDGLDPVMRRRVWGVIMQDVAERGTTVLISSHNLRELEDVCDHVGIMHKGKIILERGLSELQGNLTKVQLAFDAQSENPLEAHGFDILHHAPQGRMHMYILRGQQDELAERIKQLNPLFCDALPLSLEEIFVYELGGLDYANILL